MANDNKNQKVQKAKALLQEMQELDLTLDEPEGAELSDEELEKVAGGIRITVFKKPYHHP